MASELIDRYALIKDMYEDGYFPLTVADKATEKVMAQPTVDAVEVVHGEWLQMEFWPNGGTWRCSECGRQIMFLEGTPITEEMHYCPKCSAKMDGKE